MNFLIAGLEAQFMIRYGGLYKSKEIRRIQEMKATDSDLRSIGYETMTTLSDSDLEVKQKRPNQSLFTG